ncbi:GtrA family protein [Cellulomonas sp. P22]|uniref:GtrA family protein n=1 Tax=Cellulomonas sp. P22 TaxID=3373189 RepID=UPI00379BB912
MSILSRLYQRYKKFALFLVVGVVSFGVDAGLLVLLAGPVGIPPWLAATISFWLSVLANFSLNRVLFGTRDADKLLSHSFRYGVLLGANYCVTLAGIEVAQAVGLGLFIAKTATTAVTSIWNYFLYRHWVFK